MIHLCSKCGIERNCGCGDCGENKFEVCTLCNNNEVLTKAEQLGIPKSDLGMDPLGGYHFKLGQKEEQPFWDSVMN